MDEARQQQDDKLDAPQPLDTAELDAVAGGQKRSQVKDSNDKYANTNTNY